MHCLWLCLLYHLYMLCRCLLFFDDAYPTWQGWKVMRVFINVIFFIPLLLPRLRDEVAFVIVIVIICYHHYAGYLQLCTWNKTAFLRYIALQHSVVTIYGTRNAVSYDKSFLLLENYFPQYVCIAQCGFFSVVPRIRALPRCCSGTVWMLLWCFELPLLLLISLTFLHSTCAVFLLWVFIF